MHYLLQDLWELGTPPEDNVTLLDRNISNIKNLKIIDSSFGKGAVDIHIAKKFKIFIKMLDIVPEFIKTAKEKAKEHDVCDVCEFEVEDASKTLKEEKGKNWDCVIFCDAGDILGDQKETISQLKKILSPTSYIILNDSYLSDTDSSKLRFKGHDYINHDEWMKIFEEGIEIVDSIFDDKKEEDREKMNLKLI
ncbi:hypothetical protein ALNOE001_00140 [Candidatus Methanobinarius endosymbioticus]|uniref:Methyltransferase domain-containing protein n=1 Tax=Candidatus Methanobinarius endosymbioticus TaxID=2006182 RepID=A0A366MG71_9EURY|nr:hypothetical protein ALNOE001_00140 [Candidatus Methanobinarius endosymbioticus]